MRDCKVEHVGGELYVFLYVDYGSGSTSEDRAIFSFSVPVGSFSVWSECFS